VTRCGCSNLACLLSKAPAPSPPIDLHLLPVRQPIWADSFHSLSIQELLVLLLPPYQHPLLQLHYTDTGSFLSSSFPLLSCFCLCLSARLLARLLVLGSHRVPGTMDRGTTNPERETTFSMHFYTVGTKTFPCSRPGTTVPGTWNAASFPFRYD